ncbi:hypothetical protein [Pandoraea sp. ISTKB]|uniref:hypothetical protein n=1 Tax=Pandoraea sp. ISTKB TaxID=1586708 RepID=UPI000847BF48|nr:hypothetical protein [Pandoraea sp. ISTKB]ODP30975.1 hypothetical protein A9762_07945 [Pandoraea sp. ISTKB]
MMKIDSPTIQTPPLVVETPPQAQASNPEGFAHTFSSAEQRAAEPEMCPYDDFDEFMQWFGGGDDYVDPDELGYPYAARAGAIHGDQAVRGVFTVQGNATLRLELTSGAPQPRRLHNRNFGQPVTMAAAAPVGHSYTAGSGALRNARSQHVAFQTPAAGQVRRAPAVPEMASAWRQAVSAGDDAWRTFVNDYVVEVAKDNNLADLDYVKQAVLGQFITSLSCLRSEEVVPALRCILNDKPYGVAIVQDYASIIDQFVPSERVGEVRVLLLEYDVTDSELRTARASVGGSVRRAPSAPAGNTVTALKPGSLPGKPADKTAASSQQPPAV